ncbi:MAG: NAAT family transporter [Deltaproteobacteria bacterium]|nr:NAAT family transporter [Deltaproteobacteria bacterium]
MEFTHFLKLFAALVAVLNPLGAIPIFASLSEALPSRERSIAARTTALTVVVVLLIAAFAGEHLLHFFGISIASFRVGGGILILLMAIAMLHARRSGAKQSREERAEVQHKAEFSVVPLGIPLLAGPGSISTVILYRHQANTWEDYLILVGNICLVAAIVFLSLRFSTPLVSRLGRTGLNIIIRVMGLILAAIAVEFIAEGLQMLFPVLAA